MRARTLGHISAAPLAVGKGSTSYLLLWPTHLPSSLSPASVPSWESLRPNEKVRLELRPPPASRPTPITPDAAELAGGPPSSPVSIPPSLDYWPAAGIYFKGTTHSTFGCCPPPLFLATLRRMTAPRGQRACASSPNRLGTGPRPPQHPSSILHFCFLQSPQINPFLFASYTRALHGPVWWRNSACCCKPLPHLGGGGGGGSAPPTCPLPTGSIPPPFGEGSSGYSPPPHLTLVPLFAAIPVRGAADTKEGATGREGEGSGGGEQGWHRLWERRARVAMATADCTAARRGWGWQGGGVGMGPNWELHLGAAFSSPSPPPTWPRFLGKHPSSHMPLLITLVHCWPLPQAYPLGPGSSSLPAPQQTGVFRALTTRLSPGSLHTCISALPVISVLTGPFSTFQTLPGPPPVQRSGLPRPLYTPSLPLDPTLTHTDAD